MGFFSKIFSFSSSNFKNVAFMFLFIVILLFTFGYIIFSSSIDSSSIYTSINNSR